MVLASLLAASVHELVRVRGARHPAQPSNS